MMKNSNRNIMGSENQYRGYPRHRALVTAVHDENPSSKSTLATYSLTVVDIEAITQALTKVGISSATSPPTLPYQSCQITLLGI